MAFAVSLKSVNASAETIVSLWDRASAFEDSPSMRGLSYPPHITFAIYDAADASEQVAIATIKSMAERRSDIEIAFDRIRTFDGPPLILWADPAPRQTLHELHHLMHSAIDPKFCRPHYRPGRWVPHCTLAMRTLPDRNADALAFARDFRGRLRVVFDVIDCARLDPLNVVAEARLHPAAAQRLQGR